MNNEDNIPRDNDSIPSDRTSDAGSGLFSFEVINNIDNVDQFPAADPLDLAQDPQVPAVIADPQHNSAKKQRLKIRENLIKSLTTNVSLSVDEAEKIADESGAVASPAHLKE